MEGEMEDFGGIVKKKWYERHCGRPSCFESSQQIDEQLSNEKV
jgi:hypothetical protein